MQFTMKWTSTSSQINLWNPIASTLAPICSGDFSLGASKLMDTPVKSRSPRDEGSSTGVVQRTPLSPTQERIAKRLGVVQDPDHAPTRSPAPPSTRARDSHLTALCGQDVDDGECTAAQPEREAPPTRQQDRRKVPCRRGEVDRLRLDLSQTQQALFAALSLPRKITAEQEEAQRAMGSTVGSVPSGLPGSTHNNTVRCSVRLAPRSPPTVSRGLPCGFYSAAPAEFGAWGTAKVGSAVAPNESLSVPDAPVRAHTVAVRKKTGPLPSLDLDAPAPRKDRLASLWSNSGLFSLGIAPPADVPQDAQDSPTADSPMESAAESQAAGADAAVTPS